MVEPPRASTPPALFPPTHHDHGACLASALERARAAFDEKGLKLTPLRARVLGELAGSHTALGAYEILDRLAAKGHRLAPISIYRALDALVEIGVVHRLESRNAYFACHAGHAVHRPYLVLVCRQCGTVAEMPAKAVWDAIDQTVGMVGFAFEGSLVEVYGRCGSCAA